MAEVGRGRVRQRLAEAPLGPDPHALRHGRRASCRGLVKGRFKGVKVIQRGSSPRVVAADVIGSRGRTRVERRHAAGPVRALRLLGVLHGDQDAPTPPRRRPTRRRAARSRSSRAYRRSAGSPVTSCPPRKGTRVLIQRRTGGRWVTVDSTTAGRGGRYRAGVPKTGLYRVLFKGDAARPCASVTESSPARPPGGWTSASGSP